MSMMKLSKEESIDNLLYTIDKDSKLMDEIQDDMVTIDNIVSKQEKDLVNGNVYSFESYEYNTTMYDFFIKKYNLNSKEIYVNDKVSSEDFDRYLPYMYKISIETGTNLWKKLVEMIKSLFVKVYNAIRLVYAKVLTYFPVIEKSIISLLEFLDANSSVPPKQIDRNNLRSVINKASAILKVNKNIKDIENILNPMNRIKLVSSIGLAPINYGNAAIKDMTASNQELIDGSKKAAEDIVNMNFYSPFSNYNNILNKQDYDKYTSLVYRVDGRTIKYLTYYVNVNEYGVPLLGYSLNSQYVTFEEENTLLLGKVYTPNDIKLLLRTTLNYLGSSRNFQIEVDKMVKNIRQIGDKLIVGSDVNSDGPTSGVKRAIVNNFYKLIKPVLSAISTDIIVGYMATAKDIYGMSYKFANLWYDKAYGVAQEDGLNVGNYKTVSIELYKGKGHTNKSHNDLFESPPSLYDIEANEQLQKEHEDEMPKNALGEPVEDVLKVDNNDSDIVAQEQLAVSRESIAGGILGVIFAIGMIGAGIGAMIGSVSIANWLGNMLGKLIGPVVNKTFDYLWNGSSKDITIYFDIECPNYNPRVLNEAMYMIHQNLHRDLPVFEIFVAVFEKDNNKLKKAVDELNRVVNEFVIKFNKLISNVKSDQIKHRVEVTIPGNTIVVDAGSLPSFKFIKELSYWYRWKGADDFKSGQTYAEYLHEFQDNYFNEDWPPKDWIDDDDHFIKGPWKGEDRVDVLLDPDIAKEIVNTLKGPLNKVTSVVYKWAKEGETKFKIIQVGVVGSNEVMTGEELLKMLSGYENVSKSIRKAIKK